MASIFDTPYNPKEHEKKIYELWEKSGFFNPDVCVEKGITEKDAKVFSIALPPPNVTGILHMGHALMLTTEDIMVRYHRMKGERTLWLPGTDHAAIATQSRVEKDIQKKEGKSRYDLGREELLKRIEQFAKESHDTIISQTKVMGASCDWSREAFTLDEKRNIAVRTMFKKMYDDGLIYRGNRIVNWDPKGQTTISDDEIVYEERKAKFYTFKYSKNFPIAISTTRPETKVGDTAVAVHPEDTRYKQYVGQTFKENFCGVDIEIKIIADESVDKDFGTGALGVTPAHSMIDWEIAQRHKLPVKQVIDERARMTVGDENLLGKKTTEAREIIVTWLRENDLLIKEEEVTQNVATAERTGGIIEPMPKLQWFVNVNKPFVLEHSNLNGIKSGSETTLKNIMRVAVESEQIKIIPDYFSKTYFHWIENLNDWCISRQIWYGHRIPQFYDIANPKNFKAMLLYRGGVLNTEKIQKHIQELNIKFVKERQKEYIENVEEYVFWQNAAGNTCAISFRWANELLKDKKINIDELKSYDAIDYQGKATPECFIGLPKNITHFQDTDTLDTWFSSGLWTFSTLGWPEKTKDLEIYHPTDVLETGYEILFFWVARMILMTGYALGDVPFHTIYLHGTVRDTQGRKMSKSLGNGIDPIDVANEFGSDAGRMALIIGTAPGTDSKISKDKIKGYKHFANKIWNATRFVITGTEGADIDTKPELTPEDQQYLDDLQNTIKDITTDMENFRYYMAAEKIYHYFWHTFADIIIEASKEKVKSESIKQKQSAQWMLRQILDISLKVLHPFMPFVTETIWQEIYHGKKIMMVEQWPK